eukprot:224616_1
MPLTSLEKQMFCAFIIALICFIVVGNNQDLLYDDDDWIMDDRSRICQSQAIGHREAHDMYGELTNTIFFKHYTGIYDDLFRYIHNRIKNRLFEARNIQFEYEPDANRLRQRRRCKLTQANRLMNFLHQMKSGQIIWDAAREHGWNIASASNDFFHCLLHFVDEFYFCRNAFHLGLPTTITSPPDPFNNALPFSSFF